jgi:hypothetical protein
MRFCLPSQNTSETKKEVKKGLEVSMKEARIFARTWFVHEHKAKAWSLELIT